MTYSLKTLTIFVYIFHRPSLICSLTSFPSINHHCLLYAQILMLFCLKLEVLSFNLSANYLSLETFNVRHRDCLTYSAGIDRFGELCYNYSISNKLIQMIRFPTLIPDGDSHSPACMDLFLF